jgi:hypothetical protein
MNTDLISIIPVFPSSDVIRDIKWYEEKAGFKSVYDNRKDPFSHYAVLIRESLCIHLQWHADTADDPLLGGSVIRIYVKNIKTLFEEMMQKSVVQQKDFRTNTPWKTNEFGFFDLNHNAIFIMEDTE